MTEMLRHAVIFYAGWLLGGFVITKNPAPIAGLVAAVSWVLLLKLFNVI